MFPTERMVACHLSPPHIHGKTRCFRPDPHIGSRSEIGKAVLMQINQTRLGIPIALNPFSVPLPLERLPSGIWKKTTDQPAIKTRQNADEVYSEIGLEGNGKWVLGNTEQTWSLRHDPYFGLVYWEGLLASEGSFVSPLA